MAIAKAAHYLGVEVVHAPVTDEFVVDVDAVRALIGPRTVALFGSAATYPHGLVDPIERLGELALEHDLGLHVDGCLGGLILPWGERLGLDIPRWDFRVPGVTSISADTHKYGYAPKGTGVMLYRRQRPAPPPVLHLCRLARRPLRLAGHRRQPLGRADRRDLGGIGDARRAAATSRSPSASSARARRSALPSTRCPSCG